jgi:hypothetical protein
MCTHNHFACQSTVISNAILSIDRIRYRYGRPAAVHGIDVATQSGDHMACRSVGDWCQSLGWYRMNNESRSMPCATQKSRNSREPHAASACGHGTRRKSDRMPPDQMYARHGQQIFSTLYFFLIHNTTHCLHHYVDRGFVCQHDTLILNYMLLCIQPHPLLTLK